jgi:hypothetical protein
MAKKDRKIEWKVGSVIIITLLTLLVGFIIWFFYVGSPKEIISVADQFKPDSSWKLTQNYVESPRSFCIDVECPHVSRSWSLPQKIDRDQFKKIARLNTHELTMAKSCFEKDEDDRIIESCDAVGFIEGYRIALTYYGSDYRDNKPSIVLTVGK